MLIDINANVGHWPFRKTPGSSCKELLERMNEYGTDISVVSNMNGIFYKDTHASNEELYEEIRSDRRFKDRFIPFGIINPWYAEWKHDLDVCADKLGMKGIRLYPKYHDYKLSKLALVELVMNARDKGLVVAFTLRMIDSRGPRHWMDIQTEWSLEDVMPIIRAVPDAKYLILNAANSIHLDSEEDKKLIKQGNIVIDTSGRRMNSMNESLQLYGKDKFAFGTHTPLLDYVTGLLRIEALKEDEADSQTKEQLRSGNAKRILEI